MNKDNVNLQELTKKVQDFVWRHKDVMLKGKKTYEGCHELWGTCYPAAWFLSYLLDELHVEHIVARKKMNEHGNHTFVLLRTRKSYLRTDDMEMVFYWDYTVLDPTADQVPEGFEYTNGWKKSSPMISAEKMPHKMTRKLLELWEVEQNFDRSQ